MTDESAHQARLNIFGILVCLILSATLLQRIAVPGTGSMLPISTLFLPLIAAYAWLTGRIQLNATAALFWLALLLVGASSLVLNAPLEPVSLLSLCLVIAVQAPLMFRQSPGLSGSARAQQFFVNLMFVLSVLGAVQFFGQGLLGKELAFFMDFYFPADLKLDRLAYNTMNELYFGAGIYKSNGLFFAEPSYFCQFVAVAVIIELTTRRRVWCLAGLAIGMLSSYSGTGLLVLGLFGSLLALRTGNYSLLLGGMGVGIVAVLFGEVLQIQHLTSRIDEFTTPNSSGHARFVSIFHMLKEFAYSDLVGVVMGKGPGTVMEYYIRVPFEAHTPTWGKVAFEYGLAGLIGYFFYLKHAALQWGRPLTAPILAIYLLMGGYLTDATIVTLLFAFLILGRQDWSEQFDLPQVRSERGAASLHPG